MKVAQEIDVDNVTIVINQQNKLESQVVIEEVVGLTMPVTLTKDGKDYPVTKVGKITGTDWLVFQVQNKVATRLKAKVIAKIYESPLHTDYKPYRRMKYQIVPLDNSPYPEGAISTDVRLGNVYVVSPYHGYLDVKQAQLNALKGTIDLPMTYSSDGYTPFASAHGTVKVETADRIYEYRVEQVELIDREEPFDDDALRSFVATVDCGSYNWVETLDESSNEVYFTGTANQPITITLSSNDFTADDIDSVKVWYFSTYDQANAEQNVSREGMVLTVTDELYAEATDQTYNIKLVEVTLKEGITLRSEIQTECPITK